jgi:hypothetical protein
MYLKTTEFVTNNNMVINPHPPYSLDLAPCDFTFVSWIENKTEGTFWNSVWHPKGIASGTSTVLLKCEKMMGSLYMFPRRLFWRRWQPKLSYASVFFDLVRELLSAPWRNPSFCCANGPIHLTTEHNSPTLLIYHLLRIFQTTHFPWLNGTTWQYCTEIGRASCRERV